MPGQMTKKDIQIVSELNSWGLDKLIMVILESGESKFSHYLPCNSTTACEKTAVYSKIPKPTLNDQRQGVNFA